MGEDLSQTILRRKASAAREVFEARAMQPEKALRLALAKSADDLFDLQLLALSITCTQISSDEVEAALNDDGLLVLLDGPGEEMGAVGLEFPLVSGLVEQQTLGRISGSMPDPRPPTRTDAAMAAPFLDDALMRATALLDGSAAAQWMRGFSAGIALGAARLVALSLTAGEFHLFRARIDMAGERQGELVLILPVQTGPAATDPDAEGAEDPGGAGLPVLDAAAVIDVVLHRLRLPLARASALKPGDVIEVPRDQLADVRLEAGGAPAFAQARLGQIGGFRAIRLTTDPGGDAMLREAGQSDEAGAGAEQGGDDFGGQADAVGPAPQLADLPDIPGLPSLDGGGLAPFGGLADLPDIDGAEEAKAPAPDMAPEEDMDFPALDLSDLPGLSDGSFDDDDGGDG